MASVAQVTGGARPSRTEATVLPEVTSNEHPVGTAAAEQRAEDVVAAAARADAQSAVPGDAELAIADPDSAETVAEPAPRPRRRGPDLRGPDLRAPNLRELRRQRTREAIVDAAAELFLERGFDQVSVLEVAQRAGVVEKTVFNHFPVKEGLVFDADPPMQAALLDAVLRRPAGESVAAAAGTFIVAACSRLGDPGAARSVAELAQVIRGSHTLQVREREILGQLTDALAEQIVQETRPEPGELEPWLTAHAVMGLYQALLQLARDRVLAPTGAPDGELSEELRTRGERGLSLLQFGLAGYAKKKTSLPLNAR